MQLPGIRVEKQRARSGPRLTKSRAVDLVAFVVALALGLMLAEARLSRANERALLARGARSVRGDLYAVVAVVYPVVILIMGVEGFSRAIDRPVAEHEPAWFLSGALLFLASKALKYSAIRALGDRWTFRVLVLPGAPLVTDGPYRYIAHPNYLAVVGELAGAAMMCRAKVTGIVCVAAYAAIMWMRARFEDRHLRP